VTHDASKNLGVSLFPNFPSYNRENVHEVVQLAVPFCFFDGLKEIRSMTHSRPYQFIRMNLFNYGLIHINNNNNNVCLADLNLVQDIPMWRKHWKYPFIYSLPCHGREYLISCFIFEQHKVAKQYCQIGIWLILFIQANWWISTSSFSCKAVCWISSKFTSFYLLWKIYFYHFLYLYPLIFELVWLFITEWKNLGRTSMIHTSMIYYHYHFNFLVN
jgi:hypothetical protein